MTSHEYDALQKFARDDVLWFCPGCLNTVKATKSIQTETQKTVSEFKHEIAQRFESLEKQVTQLTENLNNSSAEMHKEFTKTFTQVLVGDKPTDQNVQTKGVTGMVKDILVEHSNEQCKEIREQDEREKNIIIYRKSEIAGTDKDTRINQDNEFVNNFLKAIDREDIEVKGVYRLGKFDEEKHNEGKCRPIKVSFHSKQNRDSVMLNLFKLKDTTGPDLANLQVGYDLSPAERDAVAEKVREAKDRSDDQYFWRVRGPHGPFGLSKARGVKGLLLPWPNRRILGPHGPKLKSNKYFNNIKLWYTNADTLTAHKLNELQAHVKLEHPDIICITEVEPKNSCDKICDEAFNINGYNMIRLGSNRGIIIYTAHHLMASELD